MAPTPALKPQRAPRPAAPAPAAQSAVSNVVRRVSRGIIRPAEKVLIYGAGKIGKSTLASMLTEVDKSVCFVDVGDSTSHLDVARVEPTPTDFIGLRSALQDHGFLGQFDAIVVDDMTTAEEFAVRHVLETKKVEAKTAEGIEDYGWGKGYVYVFEACMAILADLDALARLGKDIVLVSHVMVETVKNPDGTDFQQYQPRLRQNKNAQFRSRVLEWVYHCLYVSMDTFADSKGKAKGGSRAIYTVPTPTHWAGSRMALPDPIKYPEGDDFAKVWKLIFEKE